MNKRRFSFGRITAILQQAADGVQVGYEQGPLLSGVRRGGLGLAPQTPLASTQAVHREHRRRATTGNDMWSMDCVADRLADGRRFRPLTIVAVLARECVAIKVAQSLG